MREYVGLAPSTALCRACAVLFVLAAYGCAAPRVAERPPIETSLGMEIHADPNVMSALHALFEGDLDAFRAIVSTPREARRSLRDGLTYLHYAADTGQPDFVEYLIGLKSPLDARDRIHRFAPLHYAVMRDSTDVVELLLSSGAKPTIRDRDNWQPIHHAAARGSVPVLDALIRGGADVTANTCGRESGRQPIHVAATAGRVAILEYLLNAGIDVNARTVPNKQTPLHRAAIEGQAEAVEYLLQRGADVDAKNVNERSVLHLAAYYGQTESVRQLIAHGAELDSRDKNDVTPLQSASAMGRVDIVGLLLDAGAAIEARSRELVTPLIHAAKEGRTEVVDMLLEHGAATEARNIFGQTALYEAARHGHTPIVSLLIGRGADIEAACTRLRYTPLMLAARGGHKDVIAVLLDAEADLHAREVSGQTALHLAVREGRTSVVTLLVARGAALDLPDQNGITPLVMAVSYDLPAMTRLLLELGADVHLRTEGDYNALSIAVTRGKPEIVEMLLEHGADVAEPFGRIEWKILMTAAWNNRTDLLDLLLEHGADLEAGDVSGQRPLLIAARRQHHDMIAKLLEAGAEPYGAAEDGMTAWHYARMAGMENTVQLIEQYGGQPPKTLQLVRVYFELFRPSAQEVLLAATFNNWGAQRTPMERKPDGTWYVEVDVFDVKTGYKFIVDGQWIADPENPETMTDRGFGSVNSLLTPSERLVENYVPRDRSEDPRPVSVAFRYLNSSARNVHIAGEFNGWNVGSLLMTKDRDGVWTRNVHILPGEYAYKFVVDGDWIMDPAHDRTKIVDGVENSLVVVSDGHSGVPEE